GRARIALRARRQQRAESSQDDSGRKHGLPRFDALRHGKALAAGRRQERGLAAGAAADDGYQVLRFPHDGHQGAIVAAVHGLRKTRTLGLAAVLHEPPWLARALEQCLLEVALTPSRP